MRARTIAISLFEVWKHQTRIGDAAKLVDVTGLSRPTIDNALTYGAVQKQELVDAINKFFEDRLNREREDAKRLKELTNSNDQP